MPLLYLSQCGSTQDELPKFIQSSSEDLFAVYTFDQTNGKGQYGNSWETSVKKNIAFSVAVAADEIACSDHLLNYHTAGVFADFLANLTCKEVYLKWPNDIIVKGKKVAGMLIEKKTVSGKAYFIIGIGVNVLQENFDHLPKAGSILTQAGISFNLERFAELLYAYLLQNLLRHSADAQVLDDFNNRLFRKDQVATFEIKHIRQNGIIRKADEQGLLWIEMEGKGLQKFYHKEVDLLY